MVVSGTSNCRRNPCATSTTYGRLVTTLPCKHEMLGTASLDGTSNSDKLPIDRGSDKTPLPGWVVHHNCSHKINLLMHFDFAPKWFEAQMRHGSPLLRHPPQGFARLATPLKGLGPTAGFKPCERVTPTQAPPRYTKKNTQGPLLLTQAEPKNWQKLK